MTNELAEKSNGGEVIEVERVTPERSITLFGTTDPVEVVTLAGKVSKALSDVIEDRRLFSEISGKKHVRVEGWTLCGSMLGVFPVCIWTRQVEGGWEARVEAKLRDGSIVGAAEAQCTRTEKTWSTRDEYAIRSMAQTRATSKALRLPLGFIVSMAGYDATPAEEMVAEGGHAAPKDAPAHVPAPTPKPSPIPRSATDRTNSGGEFVVMEVKEVKEIKRGDRDGEVWVIFAINGVTDSGAKFGGTAFENAENNPVQIAQSLISRQARVHFKRNGKYVNVIAVEAA